MNKILVLGLSDNFGGIESFFYAYYKRARKSDIHFDFATVCKTITFANEFKKDGSKIFLLPSFAKKPFKYMQVLRKIIADGKYDTVYINMLSRANALPVKVAVKEKCVKEVIIHSHSGGLAKHPIKYLLHIINKNIFKSEKIKKVACSENAAIWLFGNIANVKIESNKIDEERFKFNSLHRDIIRKKYGIKNDEFLIGNVGHLSIEKNQKFLIKLLSKLNDKKVKLMIVGSGEKEEELKNAINRYNVGKQVILAGRAEDTERYYSAFDLFVLPSLFEGQPIVLLEAIANNLKCLVSNKVYKNVRYTNVEYLNLKSEKEWIEAVNNYIANNHSRVEE